MPRALALAVGLPVLLALATFASLRHSDHGCLVLGTSSSLTGFYAADAAGSFKKVEGLNISRVPDFMEVVRIKPATGGSRSSPHIDPTKTTARGAAGNAPYVLSGPRGVLFFAADSGLRPMGEGQHAHVPPEVEWTPQPGVQGKLRVESCTPYPEQPATPAKATNKATVRGVPVGGRAGGGLSGSGGSGGVSSLLGLPATLLLIGSNLAAAYLLHKRSASPDSVAVSYENLVQNGEYWRAVSASFSHFDLMHLGMNCAGLYNLGAAIEPTYGSVPFLWHSLAMVPLTIAAAMATAHLLVFRMGRESQRTQSAVGFSCVLFAWLTFASVRSKSFCTMPLLPCFSTFALPLPSFISLMAGDQELSFNVSPFVLLCVTSLIMPRASFVGHFAGIAVGFPFAWGWLEPLLCPPAFVASIAMGIAAYHHSGLFNITAMSHSVLSLGSLCREFANEAYGNGRPFFVAAVSLHMASFAVAVFFNVTGLSSAVFPAAVLLFLALLTLVVASSQQQPVGFELRGEPPLSLIATTAALAVFLVTYAAMTGAALAARWPLVAGHFNIFGKHLIQLDAISGGGILREAILVGMAPLAATEIILAAASISLLVKSPGGIDMARNGGLEDVWNPGCSPCHPAEIPVLPTIAFAGPGQVLGSGGTTRRVGSRGASTGAWGRRGGKGPSPSRGPAGRPLPNPWT